MFLKNKLKFKPKKDKITADEVIFRRLNGMILSVNETLHLMYGSAGKQDLIKRLEIQKDTLASVKFICFADKIYK